MEAASGKRENEEGIREEHHGGGIIGEASWRRHHGGGAEGGGKGGWGAGGVKSLWISAAELLFESKSGQRYEAEWLAELAHIIFFYKGKFHLHANGVRVVKVTWLKSAACRQK